MHKFLLLFITLTTLQKVAGQGFNNALQQPAAKGLSGFMQKAASINAFYDTATKANRAGYKQWKRWEWFASHHLNEQGEVANYHLLNEQTMQGADNSQQDPTQNAYHGNWQNIGHPSVNGANGNGAQQGRVNCVAFDPQFGGTVYIGAAGGGIWKTTNGGDNWANLTSNLPVLGISDMVVAPQPNNNTVYALTGEGISANVYLHKGGTVIKSTDGGLTWFNAGNGLNTPLADGNGGNRLLMHPTNANILLAAMSNGLFRTTNGGADWVQISGYNEINDIEFKPGDPNTLYFVRRVDGGDPSLYTMNLTSLFFTSTTLAVDSTVRRLEIGVTPANNNAVYVLAGPGYQTDANNRFNGLFYSANGGGSFTRRSNALASNVAFMNVGAMDLSWYTNTLYVSPTDENMVMTGSLTLARSTDGGTTLTQVTGTNIHADQHDLQRNPVNGQLWLCNDGGVYRSTDNGVTFTNRSNGLTITEIYRLSGFNGSTTKLYGTQDNGHFRYTTAPFTTYDFVLGGDGMDNLISSLDPQICYAASQNGGLARSTNGGLSFAGVALPNAGNPVNFPWISPMVQHPPTIFPISNPETIYVYGNNGILVVVNGGANIYNIGPAGISSTGLTPSLAIGSNNGGISATLYASNGNAFFINTNPLQAGANNWVARPLPIDANELVSAIAVNPANPQDVTAVCAGYRVGKKVFRSTNGGTTWVNISTSLPNVPMYSVVYGNPANDNIAALYVGTEIGVFYYNTNIGNWVPYSNGLPRVPVTDLHIDHGLNQLTAATYGRSLWQSNLYQICPTLTTVSVGISAGQYHFEASDRINASSNITGGLETMVTIKAGNKVVLQEGFRVTGGAYLKTVNGPCGTGPVLPFSVQKP